MTAHTVQIEKEKLAHAYAELFDPLKRYAYSKVHNISLSEDLVQETFLRAWKYILKGREVMMMKALLYRIVNALIIDEYRKQARVLYSLDMLTESGFDISTNEHINNGESIDIKTVTTHYIEQLPEKYKKVLYMKVILAMTTEEISAKLKQTKNNVTVQIHRGIKQIKMLHQNRSW